MSLLLLALAACSRTEDSAAPDSPGGTDTVELGVGWCGVKGIFAQSCVSCHAGDAPSGELDLTGDPYDLLVGMPSAAAQGQTLVVAGDAAGSWLYTKCAALQGDSGTPMPPPDGVGDDELALIAAWIDGGAAQDDCDGDTAEAEPWHPPGYGDPTAHGAAARLQEEACTECHGAELDGGTSGQGCDSCHEYGWRTNCVYCHGGTETDGGAPPVGIGGTGEAFPVHTAHVSDSDLKLGFACTACHTAPVDVLSVGHVFVGDTTPAVAEVDFAGGLSAQGTWDGAGTCSNLYCHGSGRADDGDASIAEAFDECHDCHPHQVSGSAGWLTMSGEHDRHLSLGGGFECGDCHKSVVDWWEPITDPSLHVDGGVSVQLVGGMVWNGAANTCDGECHEEIHPERPW